MKHATAETLATIAALLAELRALKQLVERSPGSFYLKSRAFLHFHEDASGVFADVKLDLASFTRVRVSSGKEQASFLGSVRQCLARAGQTAAKAPVGAVAGK